jgi:hypothetical protein
MATRKICDRCLIIWDPRDHEDTWEGNDMMSCTVTVVAPSNPHKMNCTEVNATWELCQTCAREIIDLLENK